MRMLPTKGGGMEISMNIRFLLLLAVLPAIAILAFIFYRDRKEKEPMKLLVLLAFLGALTIIPAVIVEDIGGEWIRGLDLSTSDAFFIECVFVIGLIEELGKYIIAVSVTWNHKEFRHSYDAIVYTVFVSLGFAIVENVLYVFAGGVGTGIVRAFTAVPLHCAVAVIMGALYGAGREKAYKGERGQCVALMVLAYMFPMLLHGVYDYAAMNSERLGIGVFFLVLILAYVIAVTLIFVCSAKDHRIDGLPDASDQGVYRKEIKKWKKRQYMPGYGAYGNSSQPITPFGNPYNMQNGGPYGSQYGMQNDNPNGYQSRKQARNQNVDEFWNPYDAQKH